MNANIRWALQKDLGQRTSIAVLMVCIFTAIGSQMPNLCISTSCPDSPSIPHVNWSACWWCLARRVVNCFTTLPPQFCINVRGMISRARLTALYGYFSTPLKNSSLFAPSVAPSLLLMASSALKRPTKDDYSRVIDHGRQLPRQCHLYCATTWS